MNLACKAFLNLAQFTLPSFFLTTFLHVAYTLRIFFNHYEVSTRWDYHLQFSEQEIEPRQGKLTQPKSVKLGVRTK